MMQFAKLNPDLFVDTQYVADVRNFDENMKDLLSTVKICKRALKFAENCAKVSRNRKNLECYEDKMQVELQNTKLLIEIVYLKNPAMIQPKEGPR